MVIQNPEALFSNQRETDYSLVLLKSLHYVFTMSFFCRAFKNDRDKVRPKDELINELSQYMLKVSDTDIAVPSGSAEDIIATWCDDSHRWLMHNDDDTYELTTYTNRVFDYVDSGEQKFNEYKAEELWNTVLEKTSELAAELVTDTRSRIRYHKEIIKKCQEEIKRQQAAIDEIKRTGIVKAKTSRESEQMMEYIRQLLSSFQLEIGRYKAKTIGLIDGFNLKISDVTKEHTNDGEAVLHLLDDLKSFKNDKAYIVVDDLGRIGANAKIMKRLEEDTRIIHEAFKVMHLPVTVDVFDEVNVDSLIIGKINGNYQTVVRRLQDMFAGRNSKEVMIVDYHLRQIDLLGKGLKNAFWKEPDKCRNMNIFAGGCTFLDEYNLLAGMDLVFEERKKNREVKVGGLSAQEPSADKVEKPVMENVIDMSIIRRNIAYVMEKYHEATMALIAKEFPLTKGARETAAYASELTKYPGRVNVREWESYRLSDDKSKKAKVYTVYSAILRAREENGYGFDK